jgi:hypothetical protein
MPTTTFGWQCLGYAAAAFCGLAGKAGDADGFYGLGIVAFLYCWYRGIRYHN